MKKLLLIPLVIILAVSIILGSCGGTEDTTTPATTSPSTTPTTSSGVIELNFSYHAPTVASLVQAIFIPWTEELQEACGGRVKIIHHSGSSLLGAEDVFDGILAGVCDMGHVSNASYPGRFPLSDISDLPFIYPNMEIAGAANHEWLLKYAMDTELKDVKLMITVPMAGQQYLGNTEIKVLEDFQGLNIRGAGKSDTAIYEQLGAIGVSIPTGDAFSALDTGMVDGIFFSWSGSLAFGFNDVTTYRTDCALWRPVHQLHLSRQVYEDLPDDIKKIFDELSTPEISRKYAAAHMAEAEVSRASLARGDERKGNPPIYIPPADELQRWKEALDPLVDSWIAEREKEGFPGQEMFDDLMNIVESYSQ